MNSLESVREVVSTAQDTFRKHLFELARRGGMTLTIYVRYLSFQFHLTNGVQRHFLRAAASPALSGRRSLRNFLYNFALEEEPHFDIAKHDLATMGLSPLPCPLDVKLWWSYYDGVVDERPFVRLGATCVLENLGAGAGELGHQLLDEAPFLNDRNTRFLQIHFHEALPHGEQIFAALEAVDLNAHEIADLREGAITGSIMYLRMARWALQVAGEESHLYQGLDTPVDHRASGYSTSLNSSETATA